MAHRRRAKANTKGEKGKIPAAGGQKMENAKKNSGRATVLGKSAQMLKNLRKYIPSGGVDSRRECRILSKSQEIANSANFGELS